VHLWVELSLSGRNKFQFLKLFFKAKQTNKQTNQQTKTPK
jgi:hypothetical protein